MTNKQILNLVALHLAAFMVALSLFILLFSTPLLASVPLFYRGLLFATLIEVMEVFALMLLKRRFQNFLTGHDIIIAGLLFALLATNIFMLLPVTLDRSISVFMLGYMAENPQPPITSAEMDKVFIDKYVHEYQMTQRRFDEQVLSGNVAQSEDGYKITPRGTRLVWFFGMVADLFRVNKRFVDPQ